MSWSHPSLLNTSAELVLPGQVWGWPDVNHCRCFSVVEPRWSHTNLPALLPLLQPWSQQGGRYCGNCADQNWSVLAGNCQLSGYWVEKLMKILNEPLFCGAGEVGCSLWDWEVRTVSCIILCVLLVFRTYSPIEFTYGKLEVNTLDVDTGSEWDGRGQERPKLFLLFTESRLNVIWPLHLNG